MTAVKAVFRFLALVVMVVFLIILTLINGNVQLEPNATQKD